MFWPGRYCGDGGTIAWNTDPLLWAALGLLLAAAVRAARPRRALLAWLAAAAAFASPLCALSSALFSARAVHHLLLLGLAAPLLAAALPRARGGPGPVAALALSTAALWGWHVPAAYDAALADKAVYWIMQATLLAGGLAYWAAVRAAAPAAAAAALAGGAGQMGLLGALLTFAPRPLYESHLATSAGFGLGPLADQQLGGLVMWTLGMAPYAAAGTVLARRGWRAAGAPLPQVPA